MPESPAPPVFSDRYQLVRHIARGGMAQVYLAQDLLLDRPVALKVLFPELSVDQAFVRRFRREAQAAANLTNPNIVSVYDWGQGDRTYFIVMEYVDGQTLSALIRQGPLEARRAASIGAEVAAALEFAHRRQVIHRDVKPGNVLIDTAGQVKVTDFGIARAVGAGAAEGLTQTGAVMGTATYFSPEQAQGHPVDARSDVYSLGVVLYEMVTGQIPFRGDNPVAIAYKHVREQPVPPRQINPAIPAALESVILQAMAKDPGQRYQTADELRSDLRRFAAGQPVLAGSSAPTGETTVFAGGDSPTRVAPAIPSPVGIPMGSTVGDGAPTTVVSPATSVSPAVAVDDRRRPPGEGPEERRHRAWVVVAVIALLLAAGLVAAYLLGAFSPARLLTVPSVKGMSAASAESKLRHSGFTKVAASPRASASVASGTVIATAPAAGTRAASNALVTVDVSSGARQVKVPSVVGRSQQAATAALKAAGFKVSPTTQASSTVAAGRVISTTPGGGQRASAGSPVALVVSSGQPKVTVPSLAGKSQIAAGQKLGNLGLNAHPVDVASSTVAAGDVIRTSPGAGKGVAPGSSVTVYVSSGVSVPGVVGDAEAQAVAAVQGAGLTANPTTQAVSSPSEDGIVLSQNPVAGSQASAGNTVTFVVGSYTAPPSTTTTTTTTTTLPATTTTLPAATTTVPPPATTLPTTTLPTTPAAG